VATWNSQVKRKDVIYVIGDFVSNDSSWKKGLSLVKDINARVVLVTGNNEDSIIRDYFNGTFIAFKQYCCRQGFIDVCRCKYLRLETLRLYLTHMPMNRDNNCLNLFGHVHKGVGQYKPFGFNMFLDLNYFKLYGEEDIKQLLYVKNKYWDKSLNFK
jgi:calcineurin-like phosphoesterase family protein